VPRQLGAWRRGAAVCTYLLRNLVDRSHRKTALDRCRQVEIALYLASQDTPPAQPFRHCLRCHADPAVIGAGTFTVPEIHELVIPRRTYGHRKDRRQSFTVEESDRLIRVVRVAARAEEAIGNQEKAAHWLRRPNRALKGKRPIDLLESDVGARLVEQVLGRIEHGMVA